MNTIKEDLFGSIRQGPVVSPDFTDDDLVKLSTPLNGDDEVINVFCVKMHQIFPINEEGRTDLLSRSGAATPTDWSGKYFEVSACPLCSQDAKFHNPVLKDYRAS